MTILTFITALLPIIWLAVALSVLKMPAHRACLVALVLACTLAVGAWKLPALWAGTAVLEGVLNALWPICLVILAALFTYNITVETGAMERIKGMLGSISPDKRVLALLIGWGFSNFMEGMAGFGTAVAIPASMMVGLGFNPLAAVVGCLVVNSTPTAFGSVGVPTATLISVTGVDPAAVASDIVLIQLPLALISPFFLVCICGGGIRALRGMLPLTTVAALSYALPWFVAGNFLPIELPDLVGSVCSMAAILLLAKPLTGKNIPAEYALEQAECTVFSITFKEGLRAWSPYIFILVLLLGTSLVTPVHNLIAPLKSTLQVYAGPNPNTLSFSWVNTAGVMIFASALAGGALQGCSAKRMAKTLASTLKAYWKTVLTICCVMSMAKVMSYSGMVGDIATVLVAVAGAAYPLIAPVIGALGGFVTGSGTSTSVLFGGLQAQTAAQLGLSPSWIAAANIMGAGIGKMVCPQSIAVGAGAAGMQGRESEILGNAFKYFALYVAVAALVCMLGATVSG